MTEPIIELKGVSHTYNVGTPIAKEVLKNIDITVNRGEYIGLMGVPGSGKTTIGKIMAGLESPLSGLVKTPGLGIGKVGLVFQFPEHQIFGNTVFADITYPLKEVLDYSAEEIENIYYEVCKKVDLDAENVRDKRPLEMSSGEKRRIAIAGILVMKPEVIIFDEPTAGLDHEGQALLLDEIGRLSAENITIVIISHNIQVLLKHTKRLILVKDGKIERDGLGDEILKFMTERDESIGMLPFVTELMMTLNRKGLNVRKDIFDPDEAFNEIVEALKKRGS